MQTQSQKIRVRYCYGQQDEFIYKMFHDLQKQFYTDIGAFDPFYNSLTTSLYLKRWKGLHLDGGYQRLIRFFDFRPLTINIPMVVDSQNQYVQMIDAVDDSSSSINKEYFEDLQQNRGKDFKVVKKYIMPSISLKNVCQRHYPKKPVFMNLDVQGNQGKALQSNNWSNQKCRPDVIIMQVVNYDKNENTDTQRHGQVRGQDVLIKNNYKMFPKWADVNQVWIQQQRFDYYSQKLNKQLKNYSSMKMIPFMELANNISQKLTSFRGFLWHYNMIKDLVYFHFSLDNEDIVLEDLLQQKQRRTNYMNLDHPIVVLEFNPLNSKIVMKERIQHTVKDHYMLLNDQTPIHFWLVTIINNYTNISIFIMDYQYEGKQDLNIQIISKNSLNVSIIEKQINDSNRENKQKGVNDQQNIQKNETYQTINKIVNGVLVILLLVILYLICAQINLYFKRNKNKPIQKKDQEPLSAEQSAESQRQTSINRQR